MQVFAGQKQYRCVRKKGLCTPVESAVTPRVKLVPDTPVTSLWAAERQIRSTAASPCLNPAEWPLLDGPPSPLWPADDPVVTQNRQFRSDMAQHKAEIDALAKQDPEFFAYLQQTDKELLQFGKGEEEDKDELAQPVEGDEVHRTGLYLHVLASTMPPRQYGPTAGMCCSWCCYTSYMQDSEEVCLNIAHLYLLMGRSNRLAASLVDGVVEVNVTCAVAAACG